MTRRFVILVLSVLSVSAQAQSGGLGELVQRLRSSDQAVQRQGLMEAVRLPAGSGRGALGVELVAALVEILESPNYLHRMFAARAIDSVQADAGAVSSALARLARDAGQPGDDQRELGDARLAAFEALRVVRADRRLLLDLVTEALSDPNPWVRGGVCMIGANLRPEAPELLPRLRELAASDPDSNVRSQADFAAKLMEKSQGGGG
ncbi:MAG: HEAT repeat domain-containing protein [Vicinamibacteria bacterium]